MSSENITILVKWDNKNKFWDGRMTCEDEIFGFDEIENLEKLFEEIRWAYNKHLKFIGDNEVNND